jgi:hypothetical protein
LMETMGTMEMMESVAEAYVSFLLLRFRTGFGLTTLRWDEAHLLSRCMRKRRGA